MRRLRNNPYVTCSAVLTRHFFGGAGRERVSKNALLGAFFFLVFFLDFGGEVFAQNGVTISSSVNSPTNVNPVEVTFRFDESVNFFEESDVNVDGGYLSNFHVETPDFATDVNLGRLGEFRIQVTSSPNTEPAQNAVIAFDFNSSGRIYSLTLNNGVYAHHSNGTAPVKNVIIPATDFTDPRDIALDSEGNIYVADSGNDRIRVYSSSGIYIRDLEGGLKSPFGVVVGPNDKIYVADSGNDRIVIYEQSGAEIGEITGTGAQALDNPVRLAVDEDQNVYVNDIGHNRVQIFDSDGNYTGTISNANGNNIQTPGSIVVDDNGFIYIADLGNIDFEDFLDFENADPMDLLPLITGTDASVKVYRRDDLSSAPEVINSGINIPVDLAIKPCGYLAVNNADAYFEEEIKIWPPSVKLFLEVIFDAKTYRILPDTFTADFTIAEECIPATLDVPAGVAKNAACIDNSASNSFSIVWDETPPEIACLANQTGTLDENGEFELPDYTEGIIEDNCTALANLIIKQTPTAGTIITETRDITITAEDEAGNISEICPFQVNVEEPEPLEVSCPADQTVDLEGACDFEIPDYTSLATATAGADLTQSPAVGTMVTEDTRIRLTATLDGESDFCDFDVIITNAAELVITCPSDQDEDADSDGNFSLPDYSSMANVQGNCGAIDITQFPVEGTVVTEDTEVTLTVTDALGNEKSCNFDVILTFPEEPEPLEISCPADQTVDLGGACEFEIPNYTSLATATEGAAVTQSPAAGTMVTEDTRIRLTATLDGESDFCDFDVILTNAAELVITCPSDQDEDAGADGNFALPNYSSMANVQGNCGAIDITQFPVEGTVVTEDTEVTLTVTDALGNEKSCNFDVILTFPEEPEPLEISCPADQTVDLEGACDFEIPNYTSLATATEGADITQSPAVGTMVTEDTRIRLTATLDGESDFCDFDVVITNAAELVTTCPSDQDEDVDSDGNFPLPDYTPLANVQGNCGAIDITQFPVEGTVVTEDTEVTLTVTDALGNEKSCNFDVILTFPEEPEPLEISCPADQTVDLEGACDFEIPDYTSLATATEGADISQSPAVGTMVTEDTRIRLTATLDGESDFCDFDVIITNAAELVITCPSDQDEDADADGNFSLPDYTPLATVQGNCGAIDVTQFPVEGTVVTEDTEITLTVTDALGNDKSCNFDVILTFPEEPDPGFECLDEFTLQLDDKGEATLLAENLYTGEGEGLTFTIDQEDFTCENIGANTVVLSYSGEESGSCPVTVTVEDNIDPVAVCLNNYNINLAPGESRTLAPELLDAGSYDACGEVAFTLSQYTFTEADAGNKTVELFVTDESGNTDSCNVSIRVNVYTTEPDFECVEEFTLQLDPNGEAILSPEDLYTGNATGVTFDLEKENYTCADTGTQTITLNYTGAIEGKCEIELTVEDIIPPVATCVSEFTLFLNEEGYGILSETIIDNGSTDNCGIEEMSLDQTRFTTADVGENTVTLTVFDAAGNSDSCESTVTVVPYDEGEQVTCAESLELPLDENGEAVLTLNYTGNPDNEEVSISKANFTCDDLGSQTITATYWGEYTGSCEIEIVVVDNLAPEVDCVQEYEVQLGEDGTASISVGDIDLGSTDNCGVEDKFLSKSDFTTADVGRQLVNFTVVDSSGNEGSCQVVVNVKPYFATSGGDCVDSLILPLGSNGEAVLTARDLYAGDPDGVNFSGEVTFGCEDLGLHEITLQNETNPDESCTVEVTVVDQLAPQARCAANFEVRLDENGSAEISAEDFGSSSVDNCGISSMSLDRSSFTTEDVGEQEVVLTVTDASENEDSCAGTVTVLPYIPPVQELECVGSVTLELNANGEASLDPESLFTGGPDSVEFSVDKENFTCADIGEQTVLFSYTTPEGEGSCEITVVVKDPESYCEPTYIVLYPNPSRGRVEIFVSPNTVIQRAEVYDMRGRYLFTKEFEHNTGSRDIYKLDLREFQSGVYNVKLITEEDVHLRRAIISGD